MDWSAAKMPILMEIPGLVIQTAGIATLLYLTYSDPMLSLFSIIVGIVWLNVSHKKSGDQVGEWRAKRHLFGKLGEWSGREDALEEFDAALSVNMQIEQGIDHEDFDGVMLAQGVGNTLRGLIATLLQIYLIVIVAWVVWEHAGPGG